jgi:hypothetical protein
MSEEGSPTWYCCMKRPGEQFINVLNHEHGGNLKVKLWFTVEGSPGFNSSAWLSSLSFESLKLPKNHVHALSLSGLSMHESKVLFIYFYILKMILKKIKKNYLFYFKLIFFFDVFRSF